MSWAFPLGTNASYTILIRYKAWDRHHRKIKELNILGNPRRLSTDKLLSILVESGFIYCLFWLTQLILFFEISRDSPVIYVYAARSRECTPLSLSYQTICEELSSVKTNMVAGGTLQWVSGSNKSGPTETPLSSTFALTPMFNMKTEQ
ncbi:hypothetical protein C8R44DRAFT_980947 [Mycena epipterygia]|nr:hypothetical protein C8R44DRAFT_980947 [Mycena epipterygia]